MKITRTGRTAALVAAVALMLSACSDDGEPTASATTDDETASASETTAAEADPKEGWPDTVVYASLPSTDQTELAARFEPVEEFLRSCLDHPLDLFAGTNYTAVVEAMRTGNVHVAKFGPFAYTLAAERANAEAFVAGSAEPDVAPVYQSVFVTLSSSGIEEAADLEGRSFGFVDPASSSGHIFPRSHLISTLGISNDEVETFLGAAVFTGSHDASVLSVLNEEVDASAVASSRWDNEELMQEEYGDHPEFENLVAFDVTDDIPRSVEAYQGDLPQTLKDALSTCFQDMVNQPELQDYLERGDEAAGYVPVEDSNYDVVRDAAGNMNMSPEELLG